MKLKQICCLILLSFMMMVLSSSSAFADPATTKVKCNDGTKVTAKKDAAAPSDILDDKDFQAACKKHEGYTAPEPDNGFEQGATKDNGCAGVETAIIKCDAKNSGALEDNGIWALLLLVINVMTAGVGVLAVGGIIYGAVLYTTAEDKADQVKKATDIITNVIIGLIAFALMWAGLNFLIPGGVFA